MNHSSPHTKESVGSKAKQWLAFLAEITKDAATAMVLLLLLVAVLLFLVYTLLSIFYPYPLDYGEAPLVDQAMRLAAGQNIYRPNITTPPYTIANYPPLYVLTLTPFMALFGPSFLVGRAISTLGALATAVFLGGIIHNQTQDRLAAAATGLIFLAIPYVTHWSSLLRIDLLALALSTAALYVLARWPAETRSTLVAALLLLAAVYTRQSYALAAPLAAFAWLWRHNRRHALTLAVVTGGGALLLFLILNGFTHGGFFFNIVTANVNEFGAERLNWNLQRLREAAPFLLLMGGAFLFLAPGRRPEWPLLVPYLIGAALSTLTIGKIGSNVNYFLELSAALSLVMGVFIAWSARRPWLHVILLASLAVQTGWLIQTTFTEFVDPWAARRSVTADLAQMARLVEESEGSILADEYMGLLTLDERLLYIQPFEVTQLAWAGVWDQTALVESIRNQEFALILIYHHPDFPLHAERWTAEMLSAIGRRYNLTNILADTYVYHPRGALQAQANQMKACLNAPWQLPSSSALGMTWQAQRLDFFGQGSEQRVPVYAVADGLLSRLPEWENQVAILHDDPLRPGQEVWSVYADMADSNGDSTIIADFPPGSTGVPVTAGQLLGYQGTWGGRPFWPTQLHLRFAIVGAAEDNTTAPPTASQYMMNPAPYLGIMDNTGQAGLRPLRCRTE